MKERNPGGNLSSLRSELERRLIVMRYSKVSTDAYLRIFGWVADYLDGYGETDYTKEYGQRFLAEYPLRSLHSSSLFKSARIVIRRIDEILENRLFLPCTERKTKSECPPHFIGLCDKYLESLARRGCRATTISGKKRYAERLLSLLPGSVLSPQELSAADCYQAFTNHQWPSVGLAEARGFLSFLFESGATRTNLSACVPSLARPKSLPSVYSAEEVTRLLSSVDRSTALGKRDYAILLLAAYLGLRSSDIAGLSFKDINRAAKTISIIQTKTARPLTLVMNREVEEAVDDYIQNGRPPSESEKIFLGSQAPFLPLSAAAGYAIAQRYFALAGIAGQGRRRGTHALRASYATALVAKGIPYAVVQEALGHGDKESAKHYVRVDVRRLKMCALDVPKPIGAFAVMLEPELRGALEGALQ